MKIIRTAFIVLFSAAVLTGSPVSAQAGKAERVMKKKDKNDDGRLNLKEWRRGEESFKEIDADGDGALSLEELQARFGGKKKKDTASTASPASISSQGKKMADGQVSVDAIDEETLCGIGRGFNCNIKVAVKLGMFETGLEPRFPEGLSCRGIDDHWAMDYTYKRDRENYHGGIDMPAPYGTPMLAAADGTVVSIYDGKGSKRGIEVILRHSPEDTGIPLWIYTQYAHMNEMPKLEIGQRVKMGEVLGPTGNSGDPGRKRGRRKKERRPAIHFAVWFSKSPHYAMQRFKLIPVKGRWMDPNALYRKSPPFDSYSMKALPDAEKQVPIPVMQEDGTTVPAQTKLIWPYACSKG